MLKKMKPIALSLGAAALTAVAFAAVSVAQNDDSGDEPKGDVFVHRAGPELSEEQRAQMEEFRSCMEENGASAPPEPPTKAEREAIEKALDACESKAPEGFEMRVGPGGPGGPCGPPHVEPGERREGAQS